VAGDIRAIAASTWPRYSSISALSVRRREERSRSLIGEHRTDSSGESQFSVGSMGIDAMRE